MMAITHARKGGQQKVATIGLAAATAIGVALGVATPPVAPRAEAATAFFTTGPLFGLLNDLGLDVAGILAGLVPLPGEPTNGTFVPAEQQLLYDAMSSTAFTGTLAPLRSIFVAASGDASYPTIDAFNEMVDNLGTVPPARSLTNINLILVNNPGRANGGFFARFPEIAPLFGIENPVTPNLPALITAGPNALNIRTIVATKIDLAWPTARRLTSR